VIQGPFLLKSKGITAPSTVGQLIAVSGVMAGVAAGFYGLARRYFDFRQVFALISASLAIGFWAAAAAPGPAVFAVAAAIIGIALGVIEPTIASELLARTPEPLHDRAMGLNVAALFFGQFLNPWIAAPLNNAGGPMLTFQTFGLIYLACGLLFVVTIATRLRKRTQ